MLKISSSIIVYQYAIDIDPDDFFENEKFMNIIQKNRKLEAAIGFFAVSGKSIYTLNEIDESMSYKVNFRGHLYTVKIDKSSGQVFNLSKDFANEDNTLSQTILNIVLNQAFRETNLKQIGRLPHFFDMTQPIDLSREGIKIWKGFKASI